MSSLVQNLLVVLLGDKSSAVEEVKMFLNCETFTKKMGTCCHNLSAL